MKDQVQQFKNEIKYLTNTQHSHTDIFISIYGVMAEGSIDSRIYCEYIMCYEKKKGSLWRCGCLSQGRIRQSFLEMLSRMGGSHSQAPPCSAVFLGCAWFLVSQRLIVWGIGMAGNDAHRKKRALITGSGNRSLWRTEASSVPVTAQRSITTL